MLTIKHRGSWKKSKNFLKKASSVNIVDILNRYGAVGVRLLQKSTPIDTGLTAMSWGYKITKDENGVYLVFTNTNVQNGVNIAILLQYDHATGTGGFVSGTEYINHALKPMFDALVDDIGKEVSAI